MLNRVKSCKSCNIELNICEFVDPFKEKIYNHCHACRVKYIERLPTKLCIMCMKHNDIVKYNYNDKVHKFCYDCYDNVIKSKLNDSH